VLAASRGAQVNGLDAAAALLAIARQRVPDGDFQVGDLEALPYADATFDAIIAANVLPYVADPAAGLRDLRRVCAAQGRLVIAWGAPDHGDEQAIATAVQDSLPAPLGEAPWTLAAPGAIEALSTHVGLRVIGGGVVTCPCFYPDRETAWQAQVSTGPLQAALRMVGAGQLKAAVLRALAPYTTRTGGIRLEQRFRYLTVVPRDDEHDRVMARLEQPRGAGNRLTTTT
jgi:SAM-dependent methyltransferase